MGGGGGEERWRRQTATVTQSRGPWREWPPPGIPAVLVTWQAVQWGQRPPPQAVTAGGQAPPLSSRSTAHAGGHGWSESSWDQAAVPRERAAEEAEVGRPLAWGGQAASARWLGPRLSVRCSVSVALEVLAGDRASGVPAVACPRLPCPAQLPSVPALPGAARHRTAPGSGCQRPGHLLPTPSPFV